MFTEKMNNPSVIKEEKLYLYKTKYPVLPNICLSEREKIDIMKYFLSLNIF